jgi:hypothetical protein
VASVSTLVITIDDTVDIVMEGSEAGTTPLGVTAYTEPAPQPRVTYAPTSPYLHGETPLSWTYDQCFLNFTVAPLGQTTEAAARALIATLRTSLARLSFNVTVNVDGAGNEVWACHAGSVTPAGGRDSINLRDHNPEWNVTIPCYPVRVS